MRLLLLPRLLPVEHDVGELIEVDGVGIGLCLEGVLGVAGVFGVAGAEPALREEALDGEAGFGPEVEVVAEANSEGMRLQRLFLVQG